MSKILKLLGIGILSLGLIGCGKEVALSEKGENEKINSNEEVTLELWSHYDGFEDAIKGFNEKYPKVKINVKVIPHENYISEYKKGLTSDNGPDLLIIDSNDYGEFNTAKSLEDLSKEEYGIKKYEENFDKELWNLGKSLDKKEILGIPFASAPMVTYYRADILEKYGFPSEPEALSEFMKDPNNWLDMARKLKKEGIYILQWIAEATKLYTANMPYYDENLIYQRNTEQFKEGIEIAQEVQKEKLFAYTDIWSDLGKKYLKEGKLAMLYLGSWGASELQGLVPEQEGKWRATSLPFGRYGWNNSTIISMSSGSKNKNMAAKFIEYYAFEYVDTNAVSSVPGYMPLREKKESVKINNKFLGNQDEKGLYESLMNKTEEYPITPFDSKAFLLWDTALNKGIEEGLKPDKIMEKIKKEEETSFKEGKEIILESMKE
ncbi:MAG: ABC transporter substrate-binding protein [Clostridium sp.]